MKVNIYHYDYNYNMVNNDLIPVYLVYDLIPVYLGYIEVEKFDAEEIFGLCNWSHWMEEKPLNLHCDISTCGHGLCLVNPETKEKWLAKSIGWLIGDEKMIYNYVLNHRYSFLWL